MVLSNKEWLQSKGQDRRDQKEKNDKSEIAVGERVLK